MKVNINNLRMVPLLFLFLLQINGRAQNCNQLYLQARDNYYYGNFEVTMNLLNNSCIPEILNNRTFYINNNQEMVFKAHKLLINCYYNLDYDYSAVINGLITFFYGVYNQNYVLNRLQNTII